MIGVLRQFRIVPFRHRQSLAVIGGALLALMFVGAPAEANPRYAAIVVDANSGQTLFARNADEKRYPASITKVMTLYILFEELEAGRLKIDTPLKVSQNAANQVPSKIGVRPGRTISVKDAIGTLVTKSANDVAVVVAENISGDVASFAQRMTRTARRIGMHNTTFKNPHGLPDAGQVTTARDIVTMGLAVQSRFPQYYGYFGLRSYTHAGTTYRNHNRLLGQMAGVDGLKTGYIRASGFNLVANLRRDGKHIVGVVMGGRTGASRDAHMREILANALPKASRGGQLLVSNPPLPTAPPARAATPAFAMLVPSTTVPATLVTASTRKPEPRYEQSIGTLVARLSAQEPVEAGSADDAPTATPQPAGGYVIQIGAFASEELARDTLNRAKSSASRILDEAKPFTETTQSNGSTLWRARFAGFEQATAEAACAELKRQSFGCFTARN